MMLEDGSLVESVTDLDAKRSRFAVWKEGTWRIEPSLQTPEGRRLVPYSAENNLLTNEVVLLPSVPAEYGTEDGLREEIQAFIHRYVDLSPLFERIASYYVLFTWVYDDFNEVPYLRFRGDYGSGKSRALIIVGSLCYKPIFASGASTISPIFRILDSFRGTLVIDEGDFRMSDEKAEVVKILNNGNAKGFPVLRSEVTSKGEFNPTAYQVFGPKLVSSRGFFDDRALESRFLTEEMGQSRLREDIPINLPDSYKAEALELRNKLLLFRFRNLGKRKPAKGLVDRTIEPRLNQIFMPLLAIINDPKAREDLLELARRYNKEIIAERGTDMEAQVLEVIRDLVASGLGTKLSVKEITGLFTDRHGEDYERKVTPKWIGSVIRKKLGLKTQKSDGVFVIPPWEEPKLARLYEKYGVGGGQTSSSRDDGDVDSDAADVGVDEAAAEAAVHPTEGPELFQGLPGHEGL